MVELCSSSEAQESEADLSFTKEVGGARGQMGKNTAVKMGGSIQKKWGQTPRFFVWRYNRCEEA